MSRFGSTATIKWSVGDTFAVDDTITLDEEHMPQYPFEESRVSDTVQYRSLNGAVYHYFNYNKKLYTFNWSNLTEAMKGSLTNMSDQTPIFNFASAGTNFGTFRMVPDSFNALETTFELYDVSFDAEEAA